MNLRPAKKKWYIANVNYSCGNSLTETILIRKAIEKQGNIAVATPEEADVIVLHPCTMHSKGSYDKIAAIKDIVAVTGAEVKLVGCVSNGYKDFIKEAEVYLSPEIPRLIGQDMPNIPVSMRQPPTMLLEQCRPEDISLIERQFGSCISVRIGTGCSNECTYCPIKLSRPTCLSVPHERVLSALREACTMDADTICLMCDDAGSYHDGVVGIGELLNQAAPIVLAERRTLSLYYIYPGIALKIEETLINLAKQGVLKYIGIPIQHTIPRILAEMNRVYDPVAVLAMVDRFARAGGKPIANVIYDHPGETWSEFISMVSKMTESSYDKVVWFSYTPYPDTKAFVRYNGDAFIDKELRERKTAYLYKLRDTLLTGRFEIGTVYYEGFGTHVP